MADPERSDGCNFLICGFRTTLRRHLASCCGSGCPYWSRRYGVATSSSFVLLGFFLGSNTWIHGTTCCFVASDSCVEVFVWSVDSRQCDGDTSANERTIDGTDDDLNDCSIGGASHYRRSQLHGRAQGLAHIVADSVVLNFPRFQCTGFSRPHHSHFERYCDEDCHQSSASSSCSQLDTVHLTRGRNFPGLAISRSK